MFKTLVDIIQDINLFRNSSKVFLELEKHLLETKAKSHFPRFSMLNTNKEGYFSPNENFATFEHRMYGPLLAFNEHLIFLGSYEFWGG